MRKLLTTRWHIFWLRPKSCQNSTHMSSLVKQMLSSVFFSVGKEFSVDGLTKCSRFLEKIVPKNYFFGLFKIALFMSRVAGEKSGEIRFYSTSGKSQEFLYQIREFLNPCSKSVKSQGTLSYGCRKLFYYMFSYRHAILF